MKTNLFKYIIPLSILLIGCTDDFLEVKPDKSVVVPETLGDFRRLLDNETIMNTTPISNFIISDNYTVPDASVAILSPFQRNGYLFEDEVYEGESSLEWNTSYSQILYANTCISGLNSIARTNENGSEWDALMGTALFYRAQAHYNLLRLFAPTYDPSEGDQIGIPIRLVPDITARYPRANQADVYAQIFEDLGRAKELLPSATGGITRPKKVSVDMLLARIHLQRQDYAQALESANAVLDQQPTLLDYNTLNPLATNTIPQVNVEVIHYSNNQPITVIFVASVADGIVDLYDDEDLRKSLFFRAVGTSFQFRGNYTGNVLQFGGMTVSEAYLIAAECEARIGSFEEGMDLLNELLRYRYRSGEFTPKIATDAEEALEIILTERRKELLFRGLRGDDLRRLNKDQRFATTITRVYQGDTLTLPPNDPRYVWPLPDIEIENGGLEQNPR